MKCSITDSLASEEKHTPGGKYQYESIDPFNMADTRIPAFLDSLRIPGATEPKRSHGVRMSDTEEIIRNDTFRPKTAASTSLTTLPRGFSATAIPDLAKDAAMDQLKIDGFTGKTGDWMPRAITGKCAKTGASAHSSYDSCDDELAP